jgi:hypothetical protein
VGTQDDADSIAAIRRAIDMAIHPARELALAASEK